MYTYITSANAHEGVEQKERNRAEREVDLSRKRDRSERGSGEYEPALIAPAPSPLERPERERQHHGDRPKQMSDALLDAIRSDRERQSADEGGRARQTQFAQPRAGGEPGEDVADELHQVPADDEPERSAERPEQKPERPARIVRLRVRLGAERVRVEPGGASVLELMSDEPPVVQGLQ